jgi:phosphohistidine swiveling domain-containing protein
MIPTNALTDLKSLLLSWKIDPSDWYVTGEAAMVISGYPITFRDKQMDILVCRSVWPWVKPEEEVSLFPPKNSPEETDLKNYIATHNITPDFHPLPHVGILAEDRMTHTSPHTEDNAVRILSPWAGIYHRKLIIDFYEKNEPGLHVFDQNKFIRWKKFVAETQQFAQQLGDEKTITTCLEVLPTIERAIAFFDKSDDDNNNEIFLKGKVAYSGTISGTVKLWDDKADCTDKIVVLQAALPYQFSKLSTAKGIITDEGGLLGHASIIAREYKVPTIIGTGNATSKLQDGDIVEINGNTGAIHKLN